MISYCMCVCVFKVKNTLIYWIFLLLKTKLQTKMSNPRSFFKLLFRNFTSGWWYFSSLDIKRFWCAGRYYLVVWKLIIYVKKSRYGRMFTQQWFVIFTSVLCFICIQFIPMNKQALNGSLYTGKMEKKSISLMLLPWNV